MAPFLANHSLGADSYKWMLYGDDDTVFNLDNVLRLLEPLDHTMPYYITDHIWFLRSLTEGENRLGCKAGSSCACILSLISQHMSAVLKLPCMMYKECQ